MVKITQLELENVKRIKSVALEPKTSGLTIVGGRNNQGKTSVLDSIAWALGGDRFKPSNFEREGSLVPPTLKVTLSNGLIVERKGKNSSLKVTDPTNKSAGQQLLNEFIEELAINLPKFLEYNSKEKAKVLLEIIGVEQELKKLDQQENELYNKRLAIGQIADQKNKYAKELPFYEDAPQDLISVAELIQRHQSILSKNAENETKRKNLELYQTQAKEIEKQIYELQSEQTLILENLAIAQKTAENLIDETTTEIQDNIENIEVVNAKVRSNLDKAKAESEYSQCKSEYDTYSINIEKIRHSKIELLNNAKLPLESLSVEDGELTYKGKKWDSMSGSDQLKVATAIVRSLNPKCGFVLLDKLEQMDSETLVEFSTWVESEGLQVIATRVSTGDECSIVIEDGYGQEPTEIEKPKFEKGVF